MAYRPLLLNVRRFVVVDNVTGIVAATMRQTFTLTQPVPPGPLDVAIDGDDEAWVLVTRTCPGSDYAEVSLTRATLRRGLLAPDDAIPAVGLVAEDGVTVEATAGAGLAPVSALSDYPARGDTVWGAADVVTVAARIDEETASGRLGFAFASEQVATFAAPLADYFTGLVASGATDLDRDGDGTVSTQELMSNWLFGALLSPDLDLDGDSGADHISAGFRFEAVRIR